MKAYFVQIKCELGKAYHVATAIADAEIASEIYSTSGNYDLLAKFYLEPSRLRLIIVDFVNMGTRMARPCGLCRIHPAFVSRC